MRRTSFRFADATHCNVCILGGGPAGIAAALRAVDYGKTVTLIEKGRIGGADLWNGALQSKTMWEMAKFAAQMRGRTCSRLFGPMDRPELDWSAVRRSLQTASERKETQLHTQLRAARVNVIKGIGTFVSPNEVEVQNIDGGEFSSVRADYYVIATGSVPREHPQYRSNGDTIVNSDHIMNIDHIPKSLVVIGAGVVGCEFASIFANFGETQVNMIEKRDRILPMEDDDIASMIQKLLEDKKVCVHNQSRLRALRVVDGQVRYSLKNEKTGEHSEHSVERALVSIGRVPNYAGLGLEFTRCRLENGKVMKDKFLRCEPYRHIYACGDAVMDMALVNAGEHQARRCIEHMYDVSQPWKERPLDNLTTILFLDQEVAAVGWNEIECQRHKIGYTMARYGYDYVGRAIAMGNTKGFVKIIVTNDHEKRVLGVRAIGPHASSIVELASLAIHHNQSAFDLDELLAAYPAVTQGFQECLRMIIGRSILKPNVFPELVVRHWTPDDFERGRAHPQTSQ